MKNKTFVSIEGSEGTVINLDISEKENIWENFDGILFPIGMMLDDDTIKNTDENLNKLISANFYCVANFISKVLNVFEEKNNCFDTEFLQLQT